MSSQPQPQPTMPQWWIPGEGIDRFIISSNIQRYLGNDATVRPGKGTGENEGVDGYFIRGYRNLTSSMIEDLRNDSVKYKAQEQRAANQRNKRPREAGPEWSHEAPTDPFGVQNPHPMNTGRIMQREGNSPRSGDHGVPRSRPPPPSHLAQVPMDTEMQLDPRPPMGFPPPGSVGFAPDGRHVYPDNARPYPPELPPSGPNYGRGPIISPPPHYGGPPPPEFPGNYPPPHYDDGQHPYPPPRGGYYPPGHDVGPPMPPRGDGQQYPNAYNNMPPSRGLDRYGQPEFQDSRYAYPSPAATVSSLTARDREPPPGMPQQARYGPAAGMPSNYDRADNDSGYGQTTGPPYDQYGRPTASPDFSPPQPPAAGPARNGNSIRRPASITDTRDAQRRRI